jgi:hypothetical protein
LITADWPMPLIFNCNSNKRIGVSKVRTSLACMSFSTKSPRRWKRMWTEIAERAVQFGGIAQGTVRAAAARSRVEDVAFI